MKRVVLALLVALAVLLPTTPALAASDVFHTSFKGQFVRALFDRIDASGCIQTFVDVFAIDRKDKIDLEEPLKTLGTYKVAIKVASGMTPEVTIVVEPKG